MLNAAHALEVALLLLTAFLIGAVSGSLARLAAKRLHAPRQRLTVYPVARVERPATPQLEPNAAERTAIAAEVPSSDEPQASGVPLEVSRTIEVAIPEPEPVLASDKAIPDPGVVETRSEAAQDTAAAVAQPVGDEVTSNAELADEPAPEAPVAIDPPAPPRSSRSRARLDDDDESAAMRAIEGNWTPRRRPARSIDEGSVAVASSGAAVVAATRAAEAVVANAAAAPTDAATTPLGGPAVPGGRPAGLKSPRQDRKDNLTHVIGILPIIETSLNSLGIFHFDQVAAFSDENAEWLERHLGIEGRIRREQWREQAHELAIAIRSRIEVDA